MKRVICLSIALFCAQLLAVTVDVSLDPQDWSDNNPSNASYSKSLTSDGHFRMTCTTYRGYVNLGGSHFNLQNATLRYKWKVNNYGTYGAGNNAPNGLSFLNFSTHHSWAGSKVISNDRWIYTEVTVGADKTCTYDYSYSGYGLGGITGGSFSVSDTLWATLGDAYIRSTIVDTYQSSFYFELAEAYLIKQNLAPTVEITSPEDDSSFEQNRTINFAATATDATEPYTYSWYSDIDGLISESISFDINTLSLGEHHITFTCTDDNTLSSTANITVNVLTVPEITPISDKVVPAGETLNLPAPEINAGAGDVEWSIVSAPEGVTIDAATGQLQWLSPELNEDGYEIEIQATNAIAQDNKTFNLRVLNKPVLDDIEDVVINEASSLNITPNLLEASLPVEWRFVSSPLGLDIDSATGSLSWPSVAGQYSPYTVTIEVSNEVGSAQKSFVINVIRPPVIAAISDIAVAEHTDYTAQAPNLYQGSEPITWSLVSGPEAMTIDPQTGVINWGDVIYNADAYLIEIMATNVVDSDIQSWQMRVVQSPILAPMDLAIASDVEPFTGEAAVLTQGSEVSYSLVDAPAGMTINSQTAQVYWANPVYSDSNVNVTIQATNIAGSAQTSFAVQVQASPVINEIPPQSALEYTSFTSEAPSLLKGTSPIEWSLVNAPEGMTIDSETGIVSWENPVSQGEPYSIIVKAQNALSYDVQTWQLDVPIGYAATVDADIDSAGAATQVNLSGSANWLYKTGAAANVPVSIQIKVQGLTRVINTVTDASGNFNTTFNPLANEAGQYTLCASHPQDKTFTAQDSFKLYGLACNEKQKYHSLKSGETIDAQIEISNLGDLPLSDFSYEIIGDTNGLELTFDMPTQIDSLGNYQLNYSLTASTTETLSDNFTLRITTAQEASVDIDFNVDLAALEYDVRVFPESLNVGMVRGGSNIVEFEVYNVGGKPSDEINIMIPDSDWLSLASSSVISTVDPNSVELVSLKLTPGEDLPLGIYSGEIIVYGSGIVKHIPFEFNCISSSIGDLEITAVDEFTYYGAGSPNVEGANVTLIDSTTGDLVATAVTNQSGVVLFEDIPESHYDLIIDEEDHGSYRSLYYVAPGIVNKVTAFMPRNLVKYTWTVVETEIQDHYELVLDTVFETTVPAPVITIEPAKVDLDQMQDGQMYVEFVITNHGLVSADDAFVRFDSNERYEVEILSDYYGEIKPNEVITVPAVIRDTQYTAQTTNSTLEVQSDDDCGEHFTGKVYYKLVCGDDNKWKTVPVYIGFWTCPDAADPTKQINPPPTEPTKPLPPEEHIGLPPSGGSGETPVSAPSGGSSGGGEGSSPLRPYIHHTTIGDDSGVNQCDPCPGKRFDAFLSCGISFLPLNCPMTALKSSWDISSTCVNKGAWSFECVDIVFGSLIGTISSCASDMSALGIVYNIVMCFENISTACDIEDQAQFDTNVLALEELTGEDLNNLSMNEETSEIMHQQAQLLADMVDGLTVIFGDPIWFSGTSDSGEVFSNLISQISQSTYESSELGQRISDSERSTLIAMPLPDNLTVADVENLCDRINRTLDYWQAGKYTYDDLDPSDDPDFIDAQTLKDKSAQSSLAADVLLSQGYTNLLDSAYETQQDFLASVNQGSQGVCAKVKVQIKQDAVMTRTAFNASLDLDNESDKSIDDVSIDIKITDEFGFDATGLFGIYPPIVSGISSLDGNASLLAQGHAQAQWIILPTTEAAPTADKKFYVGATLTYYIDGLEVVIPIQADVITVKPEAQLVVKYFHQKDVYSDDPFTEEIEPAQPYSLGMMLINTGAGDAHNVEITSAEPKIIRHEQDKDILIDFEIIEAELNAQKSQNSFILNVGDINSGDIAVARWQMVASLQGEFVSYSASFEHINGLGDPRLSLIDSVEVHELIHCVRLDSPAGDGIVDFLVNDIADTNSLPDTLYTSDGLIEPVETILNAQTDAVASGNNLEVNLSAKAIDGNVYIRLDNPSSEELSLAYVIRSDGKILLPEYNVWTTDRILRPLNEPAYRERFLHIFDTNSSGEYRLVYTTIQNPVKVSEVILKSDPVATIDVTFDVAIDPATFDWRALSLTRDFGDNLISYPIAIRALSDNTFRLSGLTYLTDQEGRYELKIKTQDILSLDNVAGASVSSITWNRVLEPWDTNSDNIVDLKDFATISEKWMNSDCDNPYWCEGADINRDGAVNFDDILLISNHWLEVID